MRVGESRLLASADYDGSYVPYYIVRYDGDCLSTTNGLNKRRVFSFAVSDVTDYEEGDDRPVATGTMPLLAAQYYDDYEELRLVFLNGTSPSEYTFSSPAEVEIFADLMRAIYLWAAETSGAVIGPERSAAIKNTIWWTLPDEPPDDDPAE